MSYTKLYYHIVFRTKNSRAAINEKHEKDLYKYIWGIVKNKNCKLFRIGGMPDHIHLLMEMPPTIALADFIRDLKTSTNKYMCDHKEQFPLFDGWGKSYCALTYSESGKDNIINYIKGQKQHHEKMSLQHELLNLFNRNGDAKECIDYFLKDSDIGPL